MVYTRRVAGTGVPPELNGTLLVVKRNRPPAQFVESLQRIDEMSEERIPAQLAVRGTLET